MENGHLYVGIGQVTILVRHSRSLKDKRQVVRSLETKLRNMGLSVVECGYQEDTRRATLGFTYAGKDPAFTQKIMSDAFQLFRFEVEVVSRSEDMFDYTEDSNNEETTDSGRWFDEEDR